MNISRNKAITCFASAAVFGLVAVWVAPLLWWLGIPAGFVAGYIIYDFRSVFVAIPPTARAAGKGCGIVVGAIASEVVLAIRKARMWLAQPHPIIWPAFAIAVIPSILLAQRWLSSELGMAWAGIGQGVSTAYAVLEFLNGLMFTCMVLGLMVLGFMVATWVATIPVALMAFVGSRTERSFWWPPLLTPDPPYYSFDLEQAAKLRSAGYTEQPLTYKNVNRWVYKGFGAVLRFTAFTWWWESLRFIVRFVPALIVRIHSTKRVFYPLCGVVGGVVGYLPFRHLATTLSADALLIVFCGFMGVAFGYAADLLLTRRATARTRT